MASSAAALSKLLARQGLPAWRCAFGYGSGVVAQANAGGAQPMVDAILCVDDARAWHASNLAAASQLCRQAKSAGACLLCLPEAFSFIGAAAAETVAQAEPLDGPRLGAYRARLGRASASAASSGSPPSRSPSRSNLLGDELEPEFDDERVLRAEMELEARSRSSSASRRSPRDRVGAVHAVR